ncbi:MAG: hypothetical protein PHQ59_01320 [Candidatus Daviesbacteria bacterium]|nr:hypothetical protein [Candidatus Daviesbacteria bacterium]
MLEAKIVPEKCISVGLGIYDDRHVFEMYAKSRLTSIVGHKLGPNLDQFQQYTALMVRVFEGEVVPYSEAQALGLDPKIARQMAIIAKNSYRKQIATLEAVLDDSLYPDNSSEFADRGQDSEKYIEWRRYCP